MQRFISVFGLDATDSHSPYTPCAERHHSAYSRRPIRDRSAATLLAFILFVPLPQAVTDPLETSFFELSPSSYSKSSPPQAGR